MNIVIAGSGKVGTTLATRLSSEGYDITLIDSNQQVLAEVCEHCDAMGVQAALVNLGNRTTYGLSADAVGVHREFLGLSADGLCGLFDDAFYGLELAGLGSAVKEDMWGVQVALGANFARRVHGLQTALCFNMTEELRGAQIGLVNYASTCSAGFQLGLVNLIMDNQIPVLPIFNCYFFH